MHYSTRKGVSCSGKMTYETRGEVDRALTQLQRKNRPAVRHRVKPYHCNVCQGYHITGMIPEKDFTGNLSLLHKSGPPNERLVRKQKQKRARQYADRERREFARALELAPA